MITTLPFRRALAAPGLAALGGVGGAVTILALLAPSVPLGDLLQVPPASRVLLAVSALALALVVGLSPGGLRWDVLAASLGALGGQALLAAVVDPVALAAVVLLVSFGVAAWPGRRSFANRVRGPAMATVLLGVGWSFVQATEPSWVGRVGALGLALGVVAAGGLVPYLSDLVPEEPASASYLAWTGFFAPAVALALPARVVPELAPDEGVVFASVLIGLGLVNLGWGTVAAWRTDSHVAAWRYSFVADWGLALVGLGLLLPDGFAAAYLALLGIVLVRLPLYLWARPVLVGGEAPQLGAVNLLVAVVLAGAAPFSGFPVRLLVLHAATQVAWPLAVPLLGAMLLWTAHAFRLARTLGRPQGRMAVGIGLTLAFSLLLGVFPDAVRDLGGL